MVITLFFLSVMVSDDSVFAFIGENVSIEEQDVSVWDDEWQFDHVYSAKFHVLMPLLGDIPSDEIAFTIYHHFGLNSPPFGKPDFSTQPFSLLFISKNDRGEYYLIKYLSFAVYPTIDERWATCGKVARFSELPCRPVEFLPRVRFPISYPREVELYADDEFIILDREVECRKGVFVEELLCRIIQTTLINKGFNLNKKPSSLCR